MIDIFKIFNQKKTIKAEPYNGDRPYVFASYKHKNKETGEYAKEEEMALRIINRMRQDGYRVWYDNEIVPSGEYDEDIEEHIDRCEVFMALISKAYFNSEWCKDEIRHACDQKKAVLPVLLEDVQYPKGLNIRLSRFQNVDKNKFIDENDFYNKIYSTESVRKCLESNAEISKSDSADSTKETDIYDERIHKVPDNMKYDREYVEMLHRSGKECLRNEKLDKAEEIFNKEIGSTFVMGGMSLNEYTILYLHSLMSLGVLHLRIPLKAAEGKSAEDMRYDDALEYWSKAFDINEKLSANGALSTGQIKINDVLICISITFILNLNHQNYTSRYNGKEVEKTGLVWYFNKAMTSFYYLKSNPGDLDNKEILMFRDILRRLYDFLNNQRTILYYLERDLIHDKFYKNEILKYI